MTFRGQPISPILKGAAVSDLPRVTAQEWRPRLHDGRSPKSRTARTVSHHWKSLDVNFVTDIKKGGHSPEFLTGGKASRTQMVTRASDPPSAFICQRVYKNTDNIDLPTGGTGRPPELPIKADSHTAFRAHAVPLSCRASKGLECVFPISFTQWGSVWFTLAMPCPCHALLWSWQERHGWSMAWAWHSKCESDTVDCVNQVGKTHSKHLAARHGRGMGTACCMWISL